MDSRGREELSIQRSEFIPRRMRKDEITLGPGAAPPQVYPIPQMRTKAELNVGRVNVALLMGFRGGGTNLSYVKESRCQINDLSLLKFKIVSSLLRKTASSAPFPHSLLPKLTRSRTLSNPHLLWRLIPKILDIFQEKMEIRRG